MLVTLFIVYSIAISLVLAYLNIKNTEDFKRILKSFTLDFLFPLILIFFIILVIIVLWPLIGTWLVIKLLRKK